jgi:hypothetical protein
MANPNWPRWIFASLADCMKQVAVSLNLPVLVETIDERTEAFMRAGDRVEIRITGPFVKELSNNYFQAFADVNVLLTSRFDSRRNAYDILKYAGTFQQAMDKPIPVMNYGSEPGDFVEDDPTTLVTVGCLLPKFGQAARVLDFGQIDVVDRLRQVEVEDRYMAELSDN